MTGRIYISENQNDIERVKYIFYVHFVTSLTSSKDRNENEWGTNFMCEDHLFDRHTWDLISMA